MLYRQQLGGRQEGVGLLECLRLGELGSQFLNCGIVLDPSFISYHQISNWDDPLELTDP